MTLKENNTKKKFFHFAFSTSYCTLSTLDIVLVGSKSYH